MDKHTVITIGRQFGSGGREIGFALAKKLGIKCYDQELMNEAAKQSGLCKEVFEMNDEKPTSSFLYSLVMDTYAANYSASGILDVPISQKVFLAQFDTIRKIAKRESCVLVGRCADYALQDEVKFTSVFINSDLETKVERISKSYNISPSKARELIIKTDKKRASYYNYYTSKKWGDSSSYDLCINSAKLGVDKVVELIINYLTISA